jgi:hypothetical protein
MSQPGRPGSQGDPVAQSIGHQPLVAAQKWGKQGQGSEGVASGVNRRGKGRCLFQGHSSGQVQDRQQRPAEGQLSQDKVTAGHARRHRRQGQQAGKEQENRAMPEADRQHYHRSQDGVGDSGDRHIGQGPGSRQDHEADTPAGGGAAVGLVHRVQS